MLSAEGTGRTIEQAIENALFELKAPREDVDIKILNEGGLFKKAKVVVTISEDARSKYEKKAEKKEKPIEKAVKLEEKAKEKVDKEQAKTAKKEEKELEKAEKKEEKRVEKEEKDYPEMNPEEFLEGLFKAAGKTVEISVKEDENYITYNVEGENLGDMIGHRGDSYYAINRILAAVTGKHEKRILLDIGGYRQKREEVLTALAKRTADKVAKTGRYARLDPMTPSDRRIVHNALSEDERVVTLSKGEDPKRYVMVFPKED